jgi:antitoxin YefM
MGSIDYTFAKNNLASIMEQVCSSHIPTTIVKTNGKSVVLMSLEDYQEMEETTYLLSSLANARQLLESIAELEDSRSVG